MQSNNLLPASTIFVLRLHCAQIATCLDARRATTRMQATPPHALQACMTQVRVCSTRLSVCSKRVRHIPAQLFMAHQKTPNSITVPSVVCRALPLRGVKHDVDGVTSCNALVSCSCNWPVRTTSTPRFWPKTTTMHAPRHTTKLTGSKRTSKHTSCNLKYQHGQEPPRLDPPIDNRHNPNHHWRANQP
jgi:hypothetical protein